MGVFGDEQERRVGGRVGDQVERGHGDAEVLRRGTVGEAERRVERGPVRRDKVGGAGPQRSQQLMQAGEGQARLRLHAGGAEHRDAAIVGERSRSGEQSRLADARFATEDQRGPPVVDPVEQRGQPHGLGLAAEQRAGVIARRDEHGTSMPAPARRGEGPSGMPRARIVGARHRGRVVGRVRVSRQGR